MVRPFPFLATCLMLLALAFLIIAASTAHWLVSYQPNVQVYEGLYNACWRQHDAAIDECRHVNNDCGADFSPPADSFTLTDSCNEWRAARAFVVLAIIFAGLAVIALYLLSFTKVSRRCGQSNKQSSACTLPLTVNLDLHCLAVLCVAPLFVLAAAALPESASPCTGAELPGGTVRTDSVGHFHRSEQKQDRLLRHHSHRHSPCHLQPRLTVPYCSLSP